MMSIIIGCSTNLITDFPLKPASSIRVFVTMILMYVGAIEMYSCLKFCLISGSIWTGFFLLLSFLGSLVTVPSH